MAAVSDKVEFYIEQTVPELQEWLRKEIFSKEEITQITSRRTRFEHLVNSREATPSIYARYASYEMNLESLRQKRVKRLGVRMPMHTGQRRIYFILDRATKKFHGDVGLWLQYIEYARKCKANKKTEELLTKVLRMHPSKPELWIYSANWALDEEGDVKAARGYLQRGLRFCERAKDLWVEYAKLEMIYVAKIAGRRRILGLDGPIKEGDGEATTEEGGVELEADTIALPSITAEDLQPASIEQEQSAEGLRTTLASNPALSGAIPMTVFDTAMKQFDRDEALAIRFFNMFASFDNVPCLPQVLQHVLNVLQSSKKQSVAAATCSFRLPLVAIDVTSPKFPAALGQSLARINAAIVELPPHAQDIAGYAVKMLVPLSVSDGLDEGLQKVIGASLRRYIKLMAVAQLASLVQDLRDSKHSAEAKALLKVGLKLFGSAEELVKLQVPSKKRSAAQIAVDY